MLILLCSAVLSHNKKVLVWILGSGRFCEVFACSPCVYGASLHAKGVMLDYFSGNSKLE